MQSIKNAVGLGGVEQQGREPVNGETGAGTAGEPYDQGNSGGKSSRHEHGVVRRKLTVSQILAKVAKRLSSPTALPMDRMDREAVRSKATSL